MATYGTFKELPVWQNAMDLAARAFKLTANGTLSKEYELKSQINKSAISVPSNIAEGFERGSKKEFIQFLYIAKGSCGELHSQLLLAEKIGALAKQESSKACDYASKVSKQIGGFIQYLKSTDYKGIKYKNPEPVIQKK